MPLGIYIHVPFCAKKCPYCDFYSCNYTFRSMEGYVNGIIRDIESFDKTDSVDTIYIGGGTPSIIPAEYIEKILKAIYEKFNVTDSEITIEINPSTVNKDKLQKYKNAGINRLSVGVQSANNKELEFLGRNHSFNQAKDVIISAKEVGFENISCDLMIGIPHQSHNSLKKSIESILCLPISHISSYILKIEEGTPFDNQSIIKQIPDEDAVSDMYLFMVSLLESNGFKQYEISNFSKNGFESRHNLKYWQCKEYLGFGPAAHSFYNKKRYCYPANVESFIKSAPEQIITDYSPADEDEKIMLGLRLTKGINLEALPTKKEKILLKSDIFIKNKLMIKSENNIRLTPKGFLVSNSIITELLY